MIFMAPVPIPQRRVISTRGFNEAVAKAQAASKPIVDTYKSKRCVPGSDADDDF